MTAAPRSAAPATGHGTGHEAPPAAPIAVGPYRHEKTLFIILATIAVLIWIALTAATIGIIWIYVLLIYLFGLFGYSALITRIKGSAVHIGPEQFPELHARLLACCQRIGLAKVPEAYLMPGHGMLNAFATHFLRRDYVVLQAEIVGALKDDPEAVNFYFGHELCHVARRHIVNGWWMSLAMFVPLAASAYRRAQEYTCDQYGMACCANPVSAQHAIAVLAAGPSEWKQMNAESFAKQCGDTSRFWMSLNELTADYPWLCKRMRHLMPQSQVAIPRRNLLAWLIAAFLPRIGASGLVGGLLGFVVAVAVLAAIGVGAYQEFVTRATYGPVFGYGSDLTIKLSRYYDERKELPADLALIGVTSKQSGLPVTDITLDENNGELRFTLDNDRAIVFVPGLDDQGHILWSCMTDLPSGAIPAASDCKSTSGKLGGLENLIERAR